MRKIHLATDHAGFDLKQECKNFLKKEFNRDGDFEIIDHGSFIYNKEDDYPDFIFPAAERVSSSWKKDLIKENLPQILSKKDNNDLAIIFGGSGQGEAMLANRIEGVRATTYYAHNKDILTYSKEHNKANVLSVGARFFAKEADREKLFGDIMYWLSYNPQIEKRHVRRIQKIERITKEYYALIKGEEKDIKRNPEYRNFLKRIFDIN